MKILLIRTAKGKNKWADQAVQEWKKRFIHKLPFEEKILKPAAAHKSIVERRSLESQKAHSYIKEGDVLIVLDERGSLWSTEQLHKKIQDSMNQSKKRLVFIIGGPFGHDPSLCTQADHILSISNMVLNHEIARVFLVEQLYRVYTLLYGGDYHH